MIEDNSALTRNIGTVDLSRCKNQQLLIHRYKNRSIIDGIGEKSGVLHQRMYLHAQVEHLDEYHDLN